MCISLPAAFYQNTFCSFSKMLSCTHRGGKQLSVYFLSYSLFLNTAEEIVLERRENPILVIGAHFRDAHVTSPAASLSQRAFKNLTFSLVLCHGEC